MSIYDNYIQGSFTSTGAVANLNIRSDFDFIEVMNLTQIATPTTGNGVKFYWQRGMTPGSAIQESLSAAQALIISQLTTNGFTPVNSALATPGAQLSGTAISSATPPLASSANTSTLATGSIIKLYNAAGVAQFNGMDFTVGSVTANTSFTLVYAPTVVAGTTFNYRIIPYQPMWYPPRRYITAITSSGINTVVKLSVTHAFTVGQEMVFSTIPSMYGMTQISGLRGLIIAIDTTLNTVTLDINSSGFTPFAFPLTAVAATAHTQPHLVPWGDGLDVTQPLQTSATLAGATKNEAFLGVSLGAGINGPAGQTGDVIYWRAWKAAQIQTTVQTYP